MIKCLRDRTVPATTIKAASDLPPCLGVRICTALEEGSLSLSAQHVAGLTGYDMESMLYALHHWFGPQGTQAINDLVCDTLGAVADLGWLPGDVVALVREYKQQVRQGGVDNQHLSMIAGRIHAHLLTATERRDSAASDLLSCCSALMMFSGAGKFEAFSDVARMGASLVAGDPVYRQKVLSATLREWAAQLLAKYEALCADAEQGRHD